jgi:pimeloyl-ACP methyl ester carboxylesterase
VAWTLVAADLKGERNKMRKARVALTLVGILVLALAALTYVSYRRDLNRARFRISTGSHVVNTASGLIEYADVGKGPPVLVIHGAGGGFDQGLEIAQPLIDRGFRVIAVSRFGYLRTPVPADASPMAQADAHAALLDVLKLDRVAVIGGSAGGPSAMQLCLRHPERCSALVLLFPLAFAPGSPQQTRVSDRVRLAGKPSRLYTWVIETTLHSDFLYWAATKLARKVLVRTVLGTPVEDFRNASGEEQARALQVMRHILPISQREKGIWNDATIGPTLPRYDLEKVRVPTLLISAEDDLYGTYRGARYSADHIPGARFVGFKTGGHLLLGHWTEATADITEFLDEHH